jgi:hypothetical protein
VGARLKRPKRLKETDMRHLLTIVAAIGFAGVLAASPQARAATVSDSGVSKASTLDAGKRRYAKRRHRGAYRSGYGHPYYYRPWGYPYYSHRRYWGGPDDFFWAPGPYWGGRPWSWGG